MLLAGGGLVAAGVVYLGGAVVGFVATEYMWRRFTPAPRPRPTPAGALALLRGGHPDRGRGALFVLLLKVDVLLLRSLTNNAEVGLYAAAYRLVEGTQFVPGRSTRRCCRGWRARPARRSPAATCSGSSCWRRC